MMNKNFYPRIALARSRSARPSSAACGGLLLAAARGSVSRITPIRSAGIRVISGLLLAVLLLPSVVQAAANAYSVRVISGGQTGIFQTIVFDSGTMTSGTFADGTPQTILHGLGGGLGGGSNNQSLDSVTTIGNTSSNAIIITTASGIGFVLTNGANVALFDHTFSSYADLGAILGPFVSPYISTGPTHFFDGGWANPTVTNFVSILGQNNVSVTKQITGFGVQYLIQGPAGQIILKNNALALLDSRDALGNIVATNLVPLSDGNGNITWAQRMDVGSTTGAVNGVGSSGKVAVWSGINGITYFNTLTYGAGGQLGLGGSNVVLNMAGDMVLGNHGFGSYQPGEVFYDGSDFFGINGAFQTLRLSGQNVSTNNGEMFYWLNQGEVSPHLSGTNAVVWIGVTEDPNGSSIYWATNAPSVGHVSLILHVPQSSRWVFNNGFGYTLNNTTIHGPGTYINLIPPGNLLATNAPFAGASYQYGQGGTGQWVIVTGGGGGSGIVNWMVNGTPVATSSNANFVGGTGIILTASGSVTNMFAIDPTVVFQQSDWLAGSNYLQGQINSLPTSSGMIALSNTLNATMLSTAAVLQAAVNILPTIATLNNASNTLVALQLASNAVLQAAINALPAFSNLTGLSNTLLSVMISNGFTGAAWLNGTVTVSNNASITSTLYVHQLQADSITANGTSTFQSLNTVTGPATMTWGSPTQSGTVETSGSAIILHQTAPAFSGYEVLVRPGDIFGWNIGSGSTSSNNIVPIYWSTTTGGGDTLALGFTSTDTGTLNTRYAYAVLPVPSLAQGWATGTGLVIRVISSSPSSLTNTLNVRITSPAGSQFTTNNLISPTSGVVSDYFIATSSLPSFANATTNDWTVRLDFQARNSATQAIVAIRGAFK